MKIIWNNFDVVWIFCSFNDVFISSYSFKMFWELIGLLSSYHNINPTSSFLVWQVCDQPSRKWLVSPCSWYFFLNAFMHWLRLAMEACISACLSSIFLIALTTVSAENSATLFTSDANSSQVSSSSDLLVGRRCTEHDHEQSLLLFRLKRRNILSRSLGGSCPDPPCAVLSGTAFPLPLSGGTMLYSSSTSLVLGDSCAPVFDPPPGHMQACDN